MNLIHTIYQPPGAGPYPTILTLHGRGANAFDLLGLAPYLCGGKFSNICPQGAAGNARSAPKRSVTLGIPEQRRCARHRWHVGIAQSLASSFLMTA